jgi:hypothetical protein
MELEGKRLQWLERVKINDKTWAGLLSRAVEMQFTQKTIWRCETERLTVFWNTSRAFERSCLKSKWEYYRKTDENVGFSFIDLYNWQRCSKNKNSKILCLQEQNLKLFLCCYFYKKGYSLVYASCFVQLVLFFYIGQIHTHFTVFTLDFLLPRSAFSSTVGIVFQVSTQNPWQMSFYKSESEASLSFLSLQTSSLDCSAVSTTQNATPQKSLCSPLSFLSLQTLSLDCSTDNTTQNATPQKSLCSPLSFLSLQTCSADSSAQNAST